MLRVCNVTKTYGNHAVLNGVSLTLEAGVCLGLVGQNGSGKSTLMRIIAQVTHPDTGDILLQEKSVLGDRQFLRRNLGYVPQEDAIPHFLTVNQQMCFWQSAVEAKNPEILELLDIPALEKQRISALSGGQRKRLSIAMALQSRPNYLVMDEALSALDSVYRTRMIDWLRGQIASGIAVLWCSHDLDELKSLCQKSVILCDGLAVDIKN